MVFFFFWVSQEYTCKGMWSGVEWRENGTPFEFMWLETTHSTTKVWVSLFWVDKQTQTKTQQWRQSFLPRLSYPHALNIFVLSNQEQTSISISLHFQFLYPSPLSLSLLQLPQPEARSSVRLLERISSMLKTLLKQVKIDC